MICNKNSRKKLFQGLNRGFSHDVEWLWTCGACGCLGGRGFLGLGLVRQNWVSTVVDYWIWDRVTMGDSVWDRLMDKWPWPWTTWFRCWIWVMVIMGGSVWDRLTSQMAMYHLGLGGSTSLGFRFKHKGWAWAIMEMTLRSNWHREYPQVR